MLIQKLTALVSHLSLEPIIFLHTFTWALGSVIQQNLIIGKVCHDLGFSEDICEDINNYDTENDVVQTQASQINMYLSILGSLPCSVVALFIGPWSDKNGRVPVMIIPMIGFILSSLWWLANVHFMDWPAHYLLVSGVFNIFGGFTVFLIGAYSFMADVTHPTSRTTRIAIFDIFFFAGVPFGTFLSGCLYKYSGYFGIFGTILILQVLIVVYIIVFIRDTRGPYSNCQDNESETNRRTSFRRYLSIMDKNQLLSVFQVTCKKRENGLRKVILILVTLMLINVIIYTDGVLYLYVRKKFKWDEQIYTKFQTLSIIISGIGVFIAMPILSFHLKLHDALVGFLASCSKMISLLITSIAWNGLVLFMGSLTGFFFAFSSIVIRSMLSKCVTKAELGKIFSLLASLEALVPMFSAPIFTFIYTNSLETWSGAVFLVQSGIFLVSALGFLSVYLTLGKSGFSQIHAEHIIDDSKQSNIVKDEFKTDGKV